MENSARVFGLAFDGGKARAALAGAVGARGGALRVRLTLDEAGRHEATSAPLEANPPHWTYAIAQGRVQSTDLLQQHKTSWRGPYEKEASFADEVLFCNERGELAEGARSNIFVERNGVLLTPPHGAGALNGCLRAELIASGRAREAVLTPDDLKNAVVYCGNSLRGLIRAVPL
jgi:para-aminobenzoate synthetase/4-amino-4-deoxychorismate lyase